MKDAAMSNDGKFTYLALSGSSVIVTVGGGAQRGTGTVLACADTAALCEVLLSLGLSDLDLLLLAATSQLLGLEGALRLELSSAMLGNVPISHDCGSFSRRRTTIWLMMCVARKMELGYGVGVVLMRREFCFGFLGKVCSKSPQGSVWKHPAFFLF